MSDLSPAEQQFFATGELSPELNIPSEPSHDPVANAGLSSAPTSQPNSTTAPPAAAATVDPNVQVAPTTQTSPDALEILTRRLADTQAQAAQLQAALEAQKAAIKTPEPPAPDPQIDPLGSMIHQLNTVAKQVQTLQDQLNQQNQQQTQNATMQQFAQQVQGLRNEFVKTTPDFPDAYNYIRDNRIADLRALGFSESQIQQSVYQDEVAIAQAAIQQGKNPAQAMYEMARRHGYTPKAPEAAPATQTDAAAKLAAAAAASAAAKNLPRTPVSDDLSLEALKTASESDLNKIVLDSKAWAKLSGKPIDDIFPSR